MSIYFTHLRCEVAPDELDNRGGVTLAFKYEETDEGLLVSYGIATCSEKDNFCRKTGRTIAQGRLMADKCESFYLPKKGLNLKEVEEIVIEHYEANYEV